MGATVRVEGGSHGPESMVKKREERRGLHRGQDFFLKQVVFLSEFFASVLNERNPLLEKIHPYVCFLVITVCSTASTYRFNREH